jgi:hypothetical protein
MVLHSVEETAAHRQVQVAITVEVRRSERDRQIRIVLRREVCARCLKAAVAVAEQDVVSGNYVGQPVAIKVCGE